MKHTHEIPKRKKERKALYNTTKAIGFCDIKTFQYHHKHLVTTFCTLCDD